jgi:GNAT superfamily N-acetyltransferase
VEPDSFSPTLREKQQMAMYQYTINLPKITAQAPANKFGARNESFSEEVSVEGLSHLRIRRLFASDIGRCTDLVIARGWAENQNTWKLLFDIGIVYGIEDEHQLIGTAIISVYGRKIGCISMVLVRKDYERRGLGRYLMDRIIRESQKFGEEFPLMLFATELGQPLYVKLGFKTSGYLGEFSGSFGCSDSFLFNCRNFRPSDLADVISLDQAAFGAYRGDMLSVLLKQATEVKVVQLDDRIAGYGISWTNGDLLRIGPVVAESTTLAKCLIASLAQDGANHKISVYSSQPELFSWLAKSGLSLESLLPMMVLNGPINVPPSSNLFCVAGAALG